MRVSRAQTAPREAARPSPSVKEAVQLVRKDALAALLLGAKLAKENPYRGNTLFRWQADGCANPGKDIWGWHPSESAVTLLRQRIEHGVATQAHPLVEAVVLQHRGLDDTHMVIELPIGQIGANDMGIARAIVNKQTRVVSWLDGFGLDEQILNGRVAQMQSKTP